MLDLSLDHLTQRGSEIIWHVFGLETPALALD